MLYDIFISVESTFGWRACVCKRRSFHSMLQSPKPQIFSIVSLITLAIAVILRAVRSIIHPIQSLLLLQSLSKVLIKNDMVQTSSPSLQDPEVCRATIWCGPLWRDGNPWYLKIYPGGESDDEEVGFVGVYLSTMGKRLRSTKIDFFAWRMQMV